jgi:hypothetical protein
MVSCYSLVRTQFCPAVHLCPTEVESLDLNNSFPTDICKLPVFILMKELFLKVELYVFFIMSEFGTL